MQMVERNSGNSENKNWLDEVQGMQRNTHRRKVFIKDERKDLQNLCKTSYVVWKRNTMLERKRDSNSEKNRKGDDSSDVGCEAIRSMKQRGVDGHVGHHKGFSR